MFLALWLSPCQCSHCYKRATGAHMLTQIPINCFVFISMKYIDWVNTFRAPNHARARRRVLNEMMWNTIACNEKHGVKRLRERERVKHRVTLYCCQSHYGGWVCLLLLFFLGKSYLCAPCGHCVGVQTDVCVCVRTSVYTVCTVCTYYFYCMPSHYVPYIDG